MVPLALLKRVARRDCQMRPTVRRKRERRNRRGERRERCQLLLVQPVPRHDRPVAAAGRERPVRRVERQAIDGVDGVVDAVAFEGVLFLAVAGNSQFGQKFNRDAALDAPEGDADAVLEECDAAGLVFEGRFAFQDDGSFFRISGIVNKG